MGRRTFSRAEADQIRRLLREKGVADRNRQKTLRGQLRRDYDFYISDFATDPGGFTASDFDALVSRGTIEINEPERTENEDDARLQAPIERPTTVLPDVLVTGLRVVFCGTAVGNTSARRGAYYAGRGNEFWPVLARVGLTPRQLAPTDFEEVLDYGIGLTDLANAESGTDQELSSEAFDVDEFKKKIEDAAPRAIGFNGKRAAEAFLGRAVSYGRQPEAVGGATIFVLPSTSTTARGFWDESHWLELARFLSNG